MKRQTILLTAMLAVAPVALIAATNSTTTAAPAPGAEHGWFKKIDANGDGVITKDEALAAANARVEKEFATFDTNHDGQITQDEIKAVHEAKRAEMEAKFEARFKQADTNGDGQLSKDEVQAGMPMLARGFDRLDTNKDGELSLDEIKAGRMAMAHRFRAGPHGWRGHGPDDGSQPDTSQAPALH
jgi:Ca2+-binding EF-hand superfamily protein